MTDIRTSDGRCVDPTHRSQSADKDWDQCQFMAHALETKAVTAKFPPKVAVGSAVDFIAKERLLGRDPDTESVVRRYLTEYGSALAALDEACVKADALLDLWENTSREDWTRRGVWGVEVEEHFPIETGAIYHVHIDVVLNDGTLIDLKTSEERLGEGRAQDDVQLTAYAAAIFSVYGHLPPGVELDGLIYANPPKDVLAMHPHLKKPWRDHQTSTRTEQQLTSWFDSAARRVYGIRYAQASGKYQTQGRTSPYACKGCPARSICPEWKGWEGLYEGSINHGGA